MRLASSTPVTGSIRMLKKSASGHRPCRAKRETGEKGAIWTEWIPTSCRPSHSSRKALTFLIRSSSLSMVRPEYSIEVTDGTQS